MDNYIQIPLSNTGEVLSLTIEALSSNVSILEESNYQNIEFITQLIKNNTIAPRFRLFILNPDETVKYQIPQEDIILSGSYSENYQNGQRRSLSFSLYNEDGKYTPSINSIWATTKIALEMGLDIVGKDMIIWFKKGVYVINNITPSRQIDRKTVDISCSDKFAIFENKQGTIPETYEIPVGTEIEEVIKDILSYSNGDGYPLDNRNFIYHSSFKGKKTPLTISQSAGGTWGQLLMQLAEILSAEIFYNAEGNLTLIPIVEVTKDSDKPSIFSYVDEEGDFQNTNFSFDMNAIVNKVHVIGANVNGHTCIASAENNDPASPICVQRIGYRVGSIINDSNITTDVLAQERADYELRQNIIYKTSVSSSIFFNPILTVNNMITYTDSFFELERERLLIQSISASLDYSGLMSLTVSNINNLPF